MAYDPAGQAGAIKPLWTGAVQLSGMVTKNIWPEFRSGSPFQGKILALDSNGGIQAIVDNGTTGTLSWRTVPSEAGVSYTSMGVVWPMQSVTVTPGAYAYVGRSD